MHVPSVSAYEIKKRERKRDEFWKMCRLKARIYYLLVQNKRLVFSENRILYRAKVSDSANQISQKFTLELAKMEINQSNHKADQQIEKGKYTKNTAKIRIDTHTHTHTHTRIHMTIDICICI